MWKRVRWGLAVGLGVAVMSLCSGCALFKGKYQLEIRPEGTITPELKQLHLIVAHEVEVGDLLRDEGQWDKLLDGSRIRRYQRYAAFEPKEGGGWELVKETFLNKSIEIEAGDESIEITVPASVLDKAEQTRFAAVVLAIYANGLKEVDVQHAELAGHVKQLLRVTATDLTLALK